LQLREGPRPCQFYAPLTDCQTGQTGVGARRDRLAWVQLMQWGARSSSFTRPSSFTNTLLSSHRLVSILQTCSRNNEPNPKTFLRFLSRCHHFLQACTDSEGHTRRRSFNKADR
jgi:hypothetical protein